MRQRWSLFEDSLGVSYPVRDLKIRGWRRQQKRRWKSEFTLFQSSSRLLQVTNFVKCRLTLLTLNPYKDHIQVQKERGNFVVARVTSCLKREIRHFHVVVVQWRQRNVQKSVMHVQSCCLVIKPIAFLTFSLPSPSSSSSWEWLSRSLLWRAKRPTREPASERCWSSVALLTRASFHV